MPKMTSVLGQLKALHFLDLWDYCMSWYVSDFVNNVVNNIYG